MTRARVRQRTRPPAIWDIRGLAEDLGPAVSLRTAETFFTVMATKYGGLVRITDSRRRYVSHEAYEAWRRDSGLPPWGQSGGIS